VYKIVIENRVKSDLKSLPSEFLEKIVEELTRLAINPRHRGVRKLAGSEAWRLRIGRYRLLYSIDDQRKVVVVYHVAHRKEVYR
jgi:mRNA interferase RelE/StbE